MAAIFPTNNSPGSSTFGILYNGENGIPCFAGYYGQTPITALPPGVSPPINICSCSHGLVVFHDQTSNIYYIGNPHYPDSYIPLPETPRQHDPQHTHVVLAIEFTEPLVYHLICAVEDSTPTSYIVDTYTSSIGCWRSQRLNNTRARIIPNTGISCGAYAYWLTESPRSIMRLDIYSPSDGWKMLLDHATPPVRETMIQLGRMGNEVALLSISVEGSSSPMIHLRVIKDGPPPGWCWYVTRLPFLNRSGSIPRPIRFGSNFVNVFFSDNGRLLLWRRFGFTDFGYTLNEVGDHVADGIFFFSTGYRPSDFPVMFPWAG